MWGVRVGVVGTGVREAESKEQRRCKHVATGAKGTGITRSSRRIGPEGQITELFIV